MNFNVLLGLTTVLLGSVWILTHSDQTDNTNVCAVDDTTCQNTASPSDSNQEEAYISPSSPTADSTDESCKNQHENCEYWAKIGECDNNPNYMLIHCAKSCNSCQHIPKVTKPVDKKRRRQKVEGVNTVSESESRSGRQVKYQYGDPNDVDSVDLNEIDNSMCPEQFPNCTHCKDVNKNCQYFGERGECEKHPGWMVMNCGQTCKLCHMHDYYTRCMNPISSRVNEYHQSSSKVFDKPGDLNKFFINILRHYVVHRMVLKDINWEYEIMSKPGHISIKEIIQSIEREYNVNLLHNDEDEDEDEYDIDDMDLEETEKRELLNRLLFVESDENRNKRIKNGPWVVLFDNYMNLEESQGIIEAAPAFERSTDVGKKDSSGHFTQITSKSRTSLNSWCQSECWAHPMVQQVMTRVEKLFNISMDNTEHLQILEYSPGQYYKTHHDYIGQQIGMPCGPRIMTFYMYLSDVEEGGETGFPKLGIEATPKLGRAILWPSVRDDAPEQIDSRTYHEAKPVKKGLKYGANSWFHLFDFQTPNIWSCTG